MFVDYFGPFSIAIDPASGAPVPDAVAQVFDITDTGLTTPLAITDMQNVPMGNLVASDNGLFPAFKCPGHTQVFAVAGGVVTPIMSMFALGLALIPDPSGLPDGYTLVSSDGEWHTQVPVAGAADIPAPAGVPDGYQLVVQGGEYVLIAPAGGIADYTGTVAPIVWDASYKAAPGTDRSGDYYYAFLWTPTEDGQVAFYTAPDGDTSYQVDLYPTILPLADGVTAAVYPAKGGAQDLIWSGDQTGQLQWGFSPSFAMNPQVSHQTRFEAVAGTTYTVIITATVSNGVPVAATTDLANIQHMLNERGGFASSALPPVGEAWPTDLVVGSGLARQIPSVRAATMLRGREWYDTIALGGTAKSGGGGVAIQGTTDGSTAVAINGDAEGDGSVAINANAHGYSAFAIDGSQAVGDYSTAITQSTANGDSATAVGHAEAYGGGAAGFGSQAIAKASSALAAGWRAIADAFGSMALGTDAEAVAPYSQAIGSAANKPVRRRERTVVFARDLEVQRSYWGANEDAASIAPQFPTNETGLILTDASGNRWRLTVSTGGAATVTSITDPGMPLTLRTISTFASFQSVAASNTGQYVIAAGMGSSSAKRYIQTSSDYGVTWTQRTAPGLNWWQQVLISSNGQTMMAHVANSSDLWVSLDAGATWTKRTGPVNGQLAGSSDLSKLIGVSMSTADKVARSTDSGATWSNITIPGLSALSQGAQAFASSANGLVLYAVATNWVEAELKGRYFYSSKVFKSTDGGTTWTTLSTLVEGAATGSAAFLVCDSTGAKLSFSPTPFANARIPLQVSTDGGSSWVAAEMASRQSSSFGALSCSSDGTKLIYGLYEGGGIYESKDSGATWHFMTGSAGTNWSTVAISGDGTHRFAAGATTGVYTT